MKKVTTIENEFGAYEVTFKDAKKQTYKLTVADANYFGSEGAEVLDPEILVKVAQTFSMLSTGGDDRTFETLPFQFVTPLGTYDVFDAKKIQKVCTVEGAGCKVFTLNIDTDSLLHSVWIDDDGAVCEYDVIKNGHKETIVMTGRPVVNQIEIGTTKAKVGYAFTGWEVKQAGRPTKRCRTRWQAIEIAATRNGANNQQISELFAAYQMEQGFLAILKEGTLNEAKKAGIDYCNNAEPILEPFCEIVCDCALDLRLSTWKCKVRNGFIEYEATVKGFSVITITKRDVSQQAVLTPDEYSRAYFMFQRELTHKKEVANACFSEYREHMKSILR